MEKELLECLVDDGLSQRQIADRLICSQTNVRHWLKVHDLRTRKNNSSGPRRNFSDASLQRSVPDASTWAGLARMVSVQAGPVPRTPSLRKRANELGLDCGHLDERLAQVPRVEADATPFHRGRFWLGAQHLAAAWYTMHGYTVSTADEKARYDLVADGSDGLRRVQVKSSTRWIGQGWNVNLTSQIYDSSAPKSANGRRRAATYSAGEIDEFFIATIDGRMFVIPQGVIGVDRHYILVPSRYENFEVFFPFHRNANLGKSCPPLVTQLPG